MRYVTYFRRAPAAGLVVLALVCASGCGKAEKLPETPKDILMQAARSGDLAKVTELLDAHPELLNARDDLEKTPLAHAASGGSMEVVKFLLDRGADANIRDKWGVSPLERAALKHHDAIVALLSQQPVDKSEPRMYNKELERQQEMRRLLNEAGSGK